MMSYFVPIPLLIGIVVLGVELSGQPEVWGKSITDPRFAIIADF
jgi:hypothetical protein